MAVPSDISNLRLWLKADSLSLSNNDPVATWTDSSGQGFNASQGTSGNRPLYKTSIIQGLPVVRFDGTDDFLTLGVVDPFTARTGEACTVFAIVSMTQAASTHWIIARDTDTSAREFAFGFDGTSAPVSQISGGAGLSGTTVSAGWHYLTWELDPAVTHKGYVDGVNTETVAGAAGPTSGDAIDIGRRGYSGFNGYAGMDLLELFAFNRRINSTEIGQMHAYAASRLAPSGLGPGMHVTMHSP